MKLFHERDQYKGYNIYSMKKYVDKKRIIFNITIGILIAITLIFVIYYTIDSTIRIHKAKQFEKQILEYAQQQEEQNQKEKEEKIPNLTDEGKQNVKNIYHSETKRAFLTFDDGPSDNTNDILDILKEKNIKATFFVLGTQVEKMPETLKRVYKEGHYIANHGYSHQYSQIYTSPESVLEEYNKCNEIVAKTIGVPEYNSHLFRFPGGLVGGKYEDIKNQANELLMKNDILHVDWNALNGDAETQTPSVEYEMQKIQETTGQKKSVVILMHDAEAKKVTVEALPQIIDYLTSQGYEFEDFYKIIK